MKSIILASAVTALGAATTANAIVLPEGKNFNAYHQFGNHPLPRAVGQKGGSLKVPMFHHNKRDLNNPDETIAFAKSQFDYVLAKWGKTPEASEKRQELKEKRQTIGLSDFGQDNFYFGQVSVGTPKQNFNVILDTGSADFWLADSSCTNSQCRGVALFNPGASSSYKGSSSPFSITYGTGAVQGTLAADTVSLAGYSVDSQTFAVVDTLASNSLQAPTSGIMGMGFQSLAQSQATPFWQVLVEQNKLSEKLFTFQMARNVNTASTSTIGPGGVFTLGELDSNQYDGEINYVSLTGEEGYWTIPLQSLSVNGQSGTLSGDTTSAIDTGTTLIIAPPSVARSIYSQIPNAQSLGGFFSSNQGAYAIPCNSNVNITMTFGGQSYTINSADMKSGQVDNRGNCLGGIIGTDLGSGAPGFIVGNVFLKNVFSIYRYQPAAVGFAALKGQAAQTASTTAGAVSASGNTAASASNAASSTAAGGGLPPLFSSISNDASDSTIAAGSGLPSPTAASTNAASNPSLTPASGVNSDNSGATSGAAQMFVSTGALVLAMAFGVVVAL